MKRLDESLVGPEEIDALGHLNVRCYMRRIRRGNERLMANLDLQRLATRGASLVRCDTYCRYRQEQYAGARLEVWGAFLGADAAGIGTLYEIRNADRRELAASFIIRFTLRDDATGAQLQPGADLLTLAGAPAIALPADRAPRTLALHPIDEAIERAVAARLIADGDLRFIDREVYPEDSDQHGFLDEEEELLFSRSRHGDMPPLSLIGAAISDGSEGLRLAWPLSETRLVSFARPRLNDVIRTISADVALGAKTRTTRRWTVNLRDGALVAVQDAVAIAIDLDRRVSVAIPHDLRAGIEGRIAMLKAIREECHCG